MATDSERRAKELVVIRMLPRGDDKPIWSHAMPRHMAEAILGGWVNTQQVWEGRQLRAASIEPLDLGEL